VFGSLALRLRGKKKREKGKGAKYLAQEARRLSQKASTTFCRQKKSEGRLVDYRIAAMHEKGKGEKKKIRRPS